MEHKDFLHGSHSWDIKDKILFRGNAMRSLLYVPSFKSSNQKSLPSVCIFRNCVHPVILNLSKGAQRLSSTGSNHSHKNSSTSSGAVFIPKVGSHESTSVSLLWHLLALFIHLFRPVLDVIKPFSSLSYLH